MKKNCANSCFRRGSAGNLLKKMKLLIAFFFAGLLGVSASSYSQQTKLSLKFDEVTVKEVFRQIEKNSEFVFFYNEDYIDVNRKVNVNVKDETVEIILSELLKGTRNTFKIYDRQVVILPHEPKEYPKTTSSEANVDQKKQISGKVTDSKGQSLPGVTVVIKGTTLGVTTNINGIYSLDIPLSAKVLIFSFVGMKTQEITLSNKSIFYNVVMQEETIGIDEVVAVGYGSMKKRDLTGSVVSIKSDDITQSKSASFVDAIQGKMAGVQISSQSGELGANSRISIRGSNSAYGSSLPLYVIDGVQIDINTNEVSSSKMGNGTQLDPMSSINPADIESIDILKDASATAIYGSRGANGVIIVTTKSGKSGKSRISYDGYVSVATVAKRIDVLNASDFIDYRKDIDPESLLFFTDSNGDGAYNSQDVPRDPYSNPAHNWQDEMLRTAISHNHNLSLDGGTNDTQFSGSVGYLSNEGIIINNEYERITTRLKLDHKKNDFKIGINMNTSYSEFNGASQSGGEGGAFNGIVQQLVTARPVEIYIPSWDNATEYVSPISMLDNAYKSTSLMRTNLNGYADYTILEGLSLNVSVGGMLSSSKGKEFYSKLTEWGAGSNGRAIINEHRAYYVSNSNQITYKKDFGKSSLNAMCAFEVNHYNFEAFGVDNSNFLDESTGVNSISKGNVLKSVYSYRDVNNRLSYLGRIYYDFNSRYLFTASIRADGSDKFGEGNRYGYFPSVAFAWRVSEEQFMKNQTLVDNLKFRLSYGMTGNERIASHQYMANMENASYNGILGLAPLSIANPKLKWESTAQYNAGVDFGVLNGRIQINMDVYRKITNDMLMPADIPSQSGFAQQWQNMGKIKNEGVEFQISTVNFKGKNFQWSTDFNISRNKNTVLDLGGVDYIPVNIGGGWITNVGRVMVGEEIGTAYGYVFDGVYQIEDFTWQDNSDVTIEHRLRTYFLKPDVVKVSGQNVKPGSFKFKNLDGSEDNTVDEKDQTVISHSSPKFFGGINNTFKYKGFDLNIFFSGSYGNEIFNESKYRLSGGTPLTWMNLSQDFWDNRWTPENPTNIYGTYSVDTQNVTSRKTSSYYVEDASFLRLKTLSLGYNVPVSFFRVLGINSISNMKFYFT